MNSVYINLTGILQMRVIKSKQLNGINLQQKSLLTVCLLTLAKFGVIDKEKLLNENNVNSLGLKAN